MARPLPLPEEDMTHLVDTCARELQRWFAIQVTQPYWPGEEDEPMLTTGSLVTLEQRRRRRWYRYDHALTTAKITATVGPKRGQTITVPVLFQLEDAPWVVARSAPPLPGLLRAFSGTSTSQQRFATWVRRRPMITLVLNGSLSPRAMAAYFTERGRFTYVSADRARRAAFAPELLSQGYNKLESMLRHEVTHLLDPQLYPHGWTWRRACDRSIQAAVAMASPPPDALPAYVNLPYEVTAFLRNVVDEATQVLDLQETGANALKVSLPSPVKRIFTSLLRRGGATGGQTWDFLEPNLKPAAKKRVMKALYRALEEETMTTRTPALLPAFDPDLPLSSAANREAARARKLRFDPRKAAYVDEDGCPRRDRFGQPL